MSRSRDKIRSEQKRLAQQLGTNKRDVPDEIRGKVRVTSPRVTFVSVREPARGPKWKRLMNRANRRPWHLGVFLLVADTDGTRLLRSVLARVQPPPNKGDLAPVRILEQPLPTEERSRFVRPATVNAVMIMARGECEAVAQAMRELAAQPAQLGIGYHGRPPLLTDDEAFFDAHWAKPHNVSLFVGGAPFETSAEIFDLRAAAMTLASAKRDKHDGHFLLNADDGLRGAQVHLRVAL